MKKPELLILLTSLGVTLTISALFGAAGRALAGSFFGWFWISLLCQFVIFVTWNSYLIQKDRNTQMRLSIDEMEALSKFNVRLSCAYCSQQHDVPIRLNSKNSFKCESCNQSNGVFMQFTATTMTTPIESVKIPLPESETIDFKVSR